MVLLGAMLAVSPLVKLDEAGQALRDHLPERKQHLVEPNIEVLKRGYEFVVQKKGGT
jgi:Pyruvate/2-oxoacid:ferredoxin oxidoreductase gamma subunit